ncbi:pyridoxal-phosphate dependent enzyme [Corynebacterium sp. ES2794-CONJ1]|uniref:pyridoxal-phosphate dependent enzyme n=1 Tax=Corynebacterium sp. ES2794-CONJ1 TaxID=2980553 RepID=UPI0021D86DD0|nr:pyridoxal-phosphate dependent enzyme [Corynebacterium sp. ES2794-CONJ1]MCU9519708.1 pyridoxal-phosphate dependent enzyme [Corynebacterium sp. ES2794-CONJ1]
MCQDSSPTSATQMVGHTPLVSLDRIHNRSDIGVYAKLEQFNLGGSAKDRTAHALINDAIASGKISEGSTLIESSSGNLGISLARLARSAGMRFHCVVDPRVNKSTVLTMKAFGAHVEMLERPDPATGDWLTARRQRVEELLAEIPDSFNLNQYANQAAFTAHAEGTMTEIIAQLGRPPSHLLVAMSTTGTLGGCAKKLREISAPTVKIGVDALGSVLYGGQRGTRLLPGYGAGVVTELSRAFHPDRVEYIKDLDAIMGARLLALSEGILPGASGGAVIAALIRLIPQLPPSSTVALVLHDGGHAYVDTVYNDTWVHENFTIDQHVLDDPTTYFKE